MRAIDHRWKIDVLKETGVFSFPNVANMMKEVVLTHCSNLFVEKQTKLVSNFANPFRERLYEF
jgi:hypothetical protein